MSRKANNIPESNPNSSANTNGLVVVGIGTSAGGLSALEEFCQYLPVEIQAAFVIIQHLSPDFKSLMKELLERKTQLPIYEIVAGMTLEAGAIYVMPGKISVTIEAGKFSVANIDVRENHFPIDVCFKSIAQAYKHKAIAVLLSGTGKDGTEGLEAIAHGGGIAMIQSPESAEFTEMSQNAVLTGLVDEILSPKDLAQTITEIVRIATNLSLSKPPEGNVESTHINKIIRILEIQEHIDFSLYKIGTLTRRIYHRCSLTEYSSIEAYITYLETTEIERKLLIQDLLINSTQFFRDPEAWKFIENQVLPSLLENLAPEQELRIWVAGCATGEEAYTLAMLVDEAIGKHDKLIHTKIFATDLDTTALEVASEGVYPHSIAKEVSSERLQTYFIEKSDQFMVKPHLRKRLIIAPHNLIKNAGFSNMNLIICRNVMIYMQTPLQMQLLRMLHFSLASQGILFLGTAEILGSLESEFISIHPKWKIYQKRRDIQLSMLPNVKTPMMMPEIITEQLTPKANKFDPSLEDIFHFCFGDIRSTCLLLDINNHVIHTFYDGAQLLNFPIGQPNLEMSAILPQPLHLPLTTAVHRAKREQKLVLYTGIKINQGDQIRTINLKVAFYQKDLKTEPCLMVMFQEETPFQPNTISEAFELDTDAIQQIQELQYELQQTRENLQVTIEELETTNEEQQAANEEQIASNEELQSTNEELHSVNEELYTVNSEYQSKIQALTELNNDMDNLLKSTNIGVVFLDRNLKIRKFTPAATKAINLLDSDIQRPITDLSCNFGSVNLMDVLGEVLQTQKTLNLEIKLEKTGNYLLMRINPYWNDLDQCDGLAITFIDINEIKHAQAHLESLYTDLQEAEAKYRHSLEQLELITDALPVCITYVDKFGRYGFHNATYELWFGRSTEEIEGRQLKEVIGEELYLQIEGYIQAALAGESVSFDMEWPIPTLGKRWVQVNYIPHLVNETEFKGFFALIGDINDRKAMEKVKDEFISVISHELRTPLTAIQGSLKLLSGKMVALDSERGQHLINMASANTQRLVTFINDVLDLERLQSFKSRLNKQTVQAAELMSQAVMPIQPLAEAADISINVSSQDIEFYGDGDRIVRVMVNLLNNALKFSDHGYSIDFVVEHIQAPIESEGLPENQPSYASCPWILFKVQDYGRGIPIDKIDTIFESFYQVDSSDSRQKTGSGLGLAICRNIVEQHGGKIWVESQLNVGSTFYFTIPLIKPENHNHEESTRDS
jgi:two-component system CheB/CheR fusion protein